MKKIRMAVAGVVVAVAAMAAAENAAPADELSKRKGQCGVSVPEAPEGYRRPRGWKPHAPYGKTISEISRDHSKETMERAREQMRKVEAVNAAGKYKPSGESMDSHKCAEWFIDAKLGIFIDWGLWSVASWCPYVKGARLYPDWYELRAFTEYGKESPFHGYTAYHRKNWGEDFKRDHFIELFKGERFDAPELMKLFRACGAKYVVPFLKHHSGFCLWDCSYTFRDTVDRGAKRDFAKEIADACRLEGLKFGMYTSQAGEWEYPVLQEDGSVKMLVEATRYAELTPDMEWKASGKVAVKDVVRNYMIPQTTEFIDKYDPDILWYDYDWATFAHENGSYEMTAYFYNRAEGRKEVVCNDRYGKAKPHEIEGRFTKRPRKWLRTVRGDFYTDEWGDTEECLDPAKWHPWESCSGISKAYGNHWMETRDMVMSEKEFVCHFADIVARGGNLLLLVNLDPQGAIPEVQRERLLQIGKWLEANGEAIYGTRVLAPFATKNVSYVKAKDSSVSYAIVKEPSAEVELECVIPEGTKVAALVGGEEFGWVRSGKGAKVKVSAVLAAAKVPYVLKIFR